MPIFVGLIVLAGIFYTVAVFSERRTGELKLWILGFFFWGFLADLAGTSIMALRATGKMGEHGYLGGLALIVMFVHLIWAFVAIGGGQKSQEFFHDNSRWAWFVWMLAFLSGWLLM